MYDDRLSKMSLLLRVFFVALIVVVALSAIRRLIEGVWTSLRIQPDSQGHLVKDPVCGTYITQESAIHAKGHFFCSEECRRKMGN